jgi:hypothetical protein
MFLNACGNNRPQVIKPPIERLQCVEEPSVPVDVTDDTVAQFIIDLRGAGQDCRSQLLWVRDFFAKQG